jgi:hypothetical protein
MTDSGGLSWEGQSTAPISVPIPRHPNEVGAMEDCEIGANTRRRSMEVSVRPITVTEELRRQCRKNTAPFVVLIACLYRWARTRLGVTN